MSPPLPSPFPRPPFPRAKPGSELITTLSVSAAVALLVALVVFVLFQRYRCPALASSSERLGRGWYKAQWVGRQKKFENELLMKSWQVSSREVSLVNSNSTTMGSRGPSRAGAASAADSTASRENGFTKLQEAVNGSLNDSSADDDD